MADDNDSSLRSILTGLATLAVIVVAFLLVTSLIWSVIAGGIVNEGEEGVHVRTGTVVRTVDSGFHVLLPLIDNMKHYSTRSHVIKRTRKPGTQDESGVGSISAKTVDKMNVDVDAVVRYSLNESQVEYLYVNGATSRKAIEDRFIKPAFQQTVREVTNDYTYGTFIRNRERASAEATELMRAKMPPGVEIETVQLRNIHGPPSVEQAIKEKKQAKIKIKEKKRRLKVAKLERKRKIIEAKGISRSNRIIGDSLSKEYLSWYFIQEGLEKSDTVYVVPGRASGVPLLTKDIDSARSGSPSGSDVNLTEQYTGNTTVPTFNTSR